jgi:hypothetical protein
MSGFFRGFTIKRLGAADITYVRYDKKGNIIDKQHLILLPSDIGFVIEVLKTGGNKALLVIPAPVPVPQPQPMPQPIIQPTFPSEPTAQPPISPAYHLQSFP